MDRIRSLPPPRTAAQQRELDTLYREWSNASDRATRAIEGGDPALITPPLHEDPIVYAATLGAADKVFRAGQATWELGRRAWNAAINRTTPQPTAPNPVPQLPPMPSPAVQAPPAPAPTPVGNVIRFGPHMEGPLPAQVANTFRGGSYSQVTLQSETTLYRVYGGTSGQMSTWWSRTRPAGPLQAQMDLALPAGNTAQSLVAIRVPQGTVIYEGAAASNFGHLGGGGQVFVPRVNPAWVVLP